MRMYTAQYLPKLSRHGQPGVPWGHPEAVAERPQWLANHWLQLPRGTERQAPNVNIGVCTARALLLRGAELHDPPLFPFSGILIASRSRFSLPPPSISPREALAVADSRLQIDPIVLVPIVAVPSCANPRRAPKHDLARSSGFSLCHDACGALESWKARQLHLKPATTRRQGSNRAAPSRLVRPRSLSRSGAEDSDLTGLDCPHSRRSALAPTPAGSVCSYRATVLSCPFLFSLTPAYYPGATGAASASTTQLIDHLYESGEQLPPPTARH